MRRQQDLENMQKAHLTPRCSHIHVSGEQCGSPAMKDKQTCYFHGILADRRPKQIIFPPLEDGNAVQLVVQQVIEELFLGRMDLKEASLLLRALRIASSNLSKTTTQQDLALERALKLIEARFEASKDLAIFKMELQTGKTPKKEAARVTQLPTTPEEDMQVNEVASQPIAAPLSGALTESAPVHVA